jgi:hypothetical protein
MTENINNMETLRELFDLVDIGVYPRSIDKKRADDLLNKLSAINGWVRKPQVNVLPILPGIKKK